MEKDLRDGRLEEEEPGLTVVHLFRFEGEKIAEMWDIAAPLPADSPNADKAF